MLIDHSPPAHHRQQTPPRHRAHGGQRSQRGAALAALLGALLLFGGCSTPTPPPRLYHLSTALPPGEPPAAERPVRGDDSASGRERWQLVGGVTVPEYLARDAVVVREGRTELRPLDGHRWAEPLRDALPRVLRNDLAALLGADRVAAGPPAVAAAAPTRLLRVEVLAFEAGADRRSVQLRARWTVQSPAAEGGAAVTFSTQQADISVPSTGTDADALVAAHRLAIWRLAQRIAAVPGL